MGRLRNYALLALALPLLAAAPTTRNQLDEWIGSLAAVDPEERKRAGEKLLAAGAEARAALVEATKSDDPEIRAQATQLLLRFPWAGAGDSPGVRAILTGYGQMDAEQRKAAVQRLSALPASESAGPLLRLLNEEPAEDVRWFAAGIVRATGGTVARERLRMLDPAGATAVGNAPLLYAMGVAWAPRDSRKSMEMFRRAVDAAGPAADASGGLDVAFNWLVAHSTRGGDYAEALRLLRKQAAREGAGDADDPSRSSAGLRLLALHADHGPFAGATDDVRAVAGKVPAGPLWYAVARMLYRGGHPAAGTMAAALGWAAGGPAVEAHYDTADFLAGQKWDLAARAELYTVLALPGERKSSYDAGARLRLSQLAAARGDDFGAAEEMRRALELIGARAGRDAAVAGLWAEVRWRYWRAAKADGDEAEAAKQMAELVKLNPTNPTIILHVTPAVKEAGHAAVAKKWFDSAYAESKARLDADPQSPEAMNNLAWLCARCGERIDEAVALSTKAIEMEPENAAYLDTAAEAQFRAGNAAEAVKLEAKALMYRPDDAFMKMQLERFEGKRTDVPMEPD